MANISQYHGEVTKCKSCTNPDLPADCRTCFARGFLAKCLNCDGKGQTRIPVAGAGSGEMLSTCSACGGTGQFAHNGPATVHAETEELQPA